MLKPAHISGARSTLRRPHWICPKCTCVSQWPYRYASTTPKPDPAKPSTHTPSTVEVKPTFWKRRNTGAPILKTLNQPIGQPDPPKPGDNSPIDVRSLRQRRDDLLDQDKILATRKELTRQFHRPYFRDWKDTRHHMGKTWLAASKLLKAETALYFPNMVGYTHADPRSYQNTTTLLSGKVSVLSLAQEQWAANQARTFTGETENPALATEMEQWKAQGLQKVCITLEEDMLKAILVWVFKERAKKQMPMELWPRSMVVRKGVTHMVKQSIGMTNSKVGYVYLVDQDCKIRWAGNGDATDEERDGLVKVVRRLMEKTVALKQEKAKPQTASSTEGSRGGRRR